jgi:hypothetical protein
MSEHQRETAFLRHIIRQGDSDECRRLEQSIAQVQSDQRCVQRVASVTSLCPLLAIAGIGYGGILEENFPYGGFELVFRLLCVLGLASLICLVVFAGLLVLYRLELNELREECRGLVKRLLESHPIKPHSASLPGTQRASEDRDAFQRTGELSGYI